MYWIYLIIFILAVFAPELAQQGILHFGNFSVRTMEELSIFFLGIIGFSLYLWKEKQLKINRKEKLKIQTEYSQVSRNLKDSYSYIGEINRKLDILKNIALGFYDNSLPVSAKTQDIYNSILDAIKIFCKTNDFSVRIIGVSTNKTALEIKVGEKSVPRVKNSSLELMGEKNFFCNDDYCIFRSPQEIYGKRSYVIVDREKYSQCDDIEIVETLATQMLVFFILSQKAKREL